jgi:quercetin 2,3-dioxygenase
MSGGADEEFMVLRAAVVACCLRPHLSLSIGVAVSKPTGFPDHPHRGFETLTYMLEVRCVFSTQCFAPLLFCSTHASCLLKRPHPCGSSYWLLQGAFTHQDFVGHKGIIRTWDVQWITTERGIVHLEMPAGDGVHKGL